VKKVFLTPLIVLIAASLVLASCGEAETEEEPPTGPTGTITSAMPDFGQESTDPVFYESLWGWSWWDPLLRWDENGNFIPWVAEEWSLDGNVWTFKIRKDIKFHNGDPLTAHDVKFSVDRFGDMTLSSNPWSYYISEAYNKVESRVVDDYTFQFVSDHPEPAQQIVFAWTRILPKDYYEEVGMEEFRKHPIGSGPWKFVELVSETSMKMEANTEYWIPEIVPEYQYYEDLQVPEEATRLAMLRTGEIDIAQTITYDRIPEMLDDGFKTVSLGPPGTSSFCIQGSWLPDAGPMGDIRVRQAMSYALDREEIAETWYAGFAEPGAQFYMYPGCFGWDEELEPDTFDKAKAEALLEEANYPDAFDDPTIHIYTTAPGQDYHLLLMDYWLDVGLDVVLEVVDAGIYNGYFFNFERIKEGDDNVGWIFTWTYQAFFNAMYHCSNMYTSWGTHNVGEDPTADELYLKAAGEVDTDLSFEYFADFQKYVKTKYWNIGIVRFDTLVLYDPETIGEWSGMNWVSYQDCLNGVKHPK
jgi:peptide/nickel transport system substrate-binding protein